MPERIGQEEQQRIIDKLIAHHPIDVILREHNTNFEQVRRLCDHRLAEELGITIAQK